MRGQQFGATIEIPLRCGATARSTSLAWHLPSGGDIDYRPRGRESCCRGFHRYLQLSQGYQFAYQRPQHRPSRLEGGGALELGLLACTAHVAQLCRIRHRFSVTPRVTPAAARAASGIAVWALSRPLPTEVGKSAHPVLKH